MYLYTAMHISKTIMEGAMGGTLAPYYRESSNFNFIPSSIWIQTRPFSEFSLGQYRGIKNQSH